MPHHRGSASRHLSYSGSSLHRFAGNPIASVQPITEHSKPIMSSAPRGPISTPLTTLLGIKHPILLAGMAHTSGAALAAAVSNAGGLGVIGGFMYTPEQLAAIIADTKAR